MAEMPFVGRDEDIQGAANTIREQFNYWSKLSSSGATLQSLKDVVNQCCTGPSGIGKTTFGQQLRVYLAKLNGITPFDEAARYATKHNLLVRIGFDLNDLDSKEYGDPERSLALRLFYALFESNAAFKAKFPSYRSFYDIYFKSSEAYNLQTVVEWLVGLFPPNEFGLIHVQFDETNFILGNPDGMRYLVGVIKELNASWTFSRKLFISALFTGTFTAALHNAVEKSASKMVPVSL